MHYTLIVNILYREHISALNNCDWQCFQDVHCLFQLWNMMLPLCLLELAVLRYITLSSCNSNTAVTVAVANRTKIGVTWARDTLLNSVSGTVIILLKFLLCNISRIPLRCILWSLKIRFENWVSVFVETLEYFCNYFHYFTVQTVCCRHIWDWIGPHYIGQTFSSNVVLIQLGKALLYEYKLYLNVGIKRKFSLVRLITVIRILMEYRRYSSALSWTRLWMVRNTGPLTPEERASSTHEAGDCARGLNSAAANFINFSYFNILKFFLLVIYT
jgi:hypothetical protein